MTPEGWKGRPSPQDAVPFIRKRTGRNTESSTRKVECFSIFILATTDLIIWIINLYIQPQCSPLATERYIRWPLRDWPTSRKSLKLNISQTELTIFSLSCSPGFSISFKDIRSLVSLSLTDYPELQTYLPKIGICLYDNLLHGN